MSQLPKQTKRRDLIKRFRELGYDGPHAGSGPHPEFMSKGNLDIKIPNSHSGDIGLALLKRVLASAGISADEWLGNKR